MRYTATRAASVVCTLCITVLLVPAVLLLRIIKPLYRIRYGYFIADRIGHFAFDVGHYLSGSEASPNQRGRDIFFFEGRDEKISLFVDWIHQLQLVEKAIADILLI